jgi:hypothetical protein
VVGKSSSGLEEEQDMEDVHRIHQPQLCLPKEEFVLPQIDQIFDSTAGSESLCFLDAYISYN